MAFRSRLSWLGSLCLGALLAGPTPVAAEPAMISPPSGRIPAVYLGPRVLAPAEEGIGRLIPDLVLHGIDGKPSRLHDAGGRLGTVIVVRDPECPVSRRYAPRVAQLARQFTDADFGFVFIYPSETLDRDRRRQDARSLAANGVYVERGSFALAESLGVKSTGEVFVLDSAHRLRFRGAVDDQYGLGYTRDLPTAHYLRNALDALVDGRPVPVPATSAPGCYIDADPVKDRSFPPLQDGQMLSLKSAGGFDV
jgi:hypothetical protein